LPGQSGYAREALEEVEGYSFAFEQGSGRAGHVGYAISLKKVVSVLVEDFQIGYAPSKFVDDREEFGSRED
jgi:hypothetical protein